MQRRLDYPNLNCDTCAQLHAQGDLADADFPCALCPRRIMPEPDEVTQTAQQIYAWMARYPFPEHGLDLSFLFRLAGLTLGSRLSREVYERIGQQLALEREHREKREGAKPAARPGDQRGGTQT
jgi:hypothetical protein